MLYLYLKGALEHAYSSHSLCASVKGASLWQGKSICAALEQRAVAAMLWFMVVHGCNSPGGLVSHDRSHHGLHPALMAVKLMIPPHLRVMPLNSSTWMRFVRRQAGQMKAMDKMTMPMPNHCHMGLCWGMTATRLSAAMQP